MGRRGSTGRIVLLGHRKGGGRVRRKGVEGHDRRP